MGYPGWNHSKPYPGRPAGQADSGPGSGVGRGTTYIGGALWPHFLADACTQLRQYQEIVICIRPDDALAVALPAAPDYEGMAIDFADRSQSVELSQFAELPPGYHLRRIDAEIVPALEGFDYYVAMFGSVERALQQTIGYCIVYVGTVVSEAVAGPLSRGIAEIGVGTSMSHRTRGFATAVSARVIQECEALGYRAFWNASQQNAASI